jgi:hypothetical protein
MTNRPVSKVTIQLSKQEREALVRSARQNLRLPQHQARYLLRLALGLTSDQADAPMLIGSETGGLPDDTES